MEELLAEWEEQIRILSLYDSPTIKGIVRGYRAAHADLTDYMKGRGIESEVRTV